MATYAVPREKSFRDRQRLVRRTVLKIEPTSDPFEVLVTVPACKYDRKPIPIHRVINAETRGRVPEFCCDDCKVRYESENRPSRAKKVTTSASTPAKRLKRGR